MKTQTHLEYINFLSSLPEELHNIYSENYDITGRPITDFPKNNIIIALLNKNTHAGGEAFLDDMKVLFPEIHREEAAIYYNVFIEGAQWIKNKLIGEKSE